MTTGLKHLSLVKFTSSHKLSPNLLLDAEKSLAIYAYKIVCKLTLKPQCQMKSHLLS